MTHRPITAHDFYAFSALSLRIFDLKDFIHRHTSPATNMVACVKLEIEEITTQAAHQGNAKVRTYVHPTRQGYRLILGKTEHDFLESRQIAHRFVKFKREIQLAFTDKDEAMAYYLRFKGA